MIVGRWIRVGRIAAALAFAVGRVVAQDTSTVSKVQPESVTVVPGAEYAAGSFARFVFGDHYRDLWTTPIKVPVLSLSRYAGGLQARKRGGSMQTKSLRFAGADGREYVFRSVNKDPSRSLPPELRETYATRILRDLISAEHPGGSLVVARLLDATGVLHAAPQLVVMPNDPLLGEFQGEFSGMLGWLEVRPTDDADDDGAGAFAGADKIVGSEELFDRITKHENERVDVHAVLTARLFDVFVGDWDRHADQWRWARFGDAPDRIWQPIPRDRDWALVRLDGLVWSLARVAYPYPQFVSFNRDYPEPLWLTWNGRLLDRRFLSGLERPVWDSVAASLRQQLSDSVIEGAIHELPLQFAPSAGKLRRALISRRDHLDEIARRFYAQLADEVDVHGTDASEVVTVDRVDDRVTVVTIQTPTRSGEPRTRPSLQRRFDARETSEIRIYLHGGDDLVVMRGRPSARTVIRVVGGGGQNVLADSVAGRRSARVYYYDTAAALGAAANAGVKIDRRPYTPPATRRGWIDPPRDWGSRWRTLPWLGYNPDIGLFLGGGPLFERYGMRADPYLYQMSLRAGLATGVGRWRADFAADVRRRASAVHTTLKVRASELDIIHFYGFGNESPGPGTRLEHRVDLQSIDVEPMVHVPLAPHFSLGIGATARFASTDLDSGRFVSDVRPYGIGHFGEVGARARLSIDTRDVPENAKRGVFASSEVTMYPSVWGASSAFGALRWEVSTYVSAPVALEPTLALRIGGDKLWGTYPFFDAAFVGGSSTVRGWREQRFAGDASLYGNAELRTFLTRFFFLLPGDLGAFALADAGRVYSPGERSDTWHSSLGGGLWVSFLGRGNTFSIARASGREGSGIYFRSGLMF